MSGGAPVSVAIVEDAVLIAAALAAEMEGLGLAVCGVVDNAVDAVALVVRKRPALVLMDVNLNGGQDGVDAASAIRTLADTKVIFVTAVEDAAVTRRIAAVAPEAVLHKPVSSHQLRQAVREALGL